MSFLRFQKETQKHPYTQRSNTVYTATCFVDIRVREDIRCYKLLHKCFKTEPSHVRQYRIVNDLPDPVMLARPADYPTDLSQLCDETTQAVQIMLSC